ncbi:hypothetical protein N7452_006120 [Penicillium brevicompactum]|uniref:Uncharacterized protein n=1 Tax=Penicillium brevicompactum TaxID=5074 RepID=A0A9W9QJX6_PENBR|nr:hypothetical protein N7452_006120 [Penicillium brevicompactum]
MERGAVDGQLSRNLESGDGHLAVITTLISYRRGTQSLVVSDSKLVKNDFLLFSTGWLVHLNLVSKEE